MKILLSLALPLILAGCATGSHVITGNVRPALAADGVKFYSEPPAKYDVIGNVSFFGTASTSKRQKEQMLNGIKSEAAKIGANGIILGSMRVDVWSGGNIDGKAIWVDEKPSQ
jgi:hypothetical protein